MQYNVLHGRDTSKTNGTCLQGYITCTYKQLVEHFGEPGKGDEYKIDAEWCLEFEDGTIATVYNWKDGHNYNGAEGTDVQDIGEWHIGGKSSQAVTAVQGVIGTEVQVGW